MTSPTKIRRTLFTNLGFTCRGIWASRYFDHELGKSGKRSAIVYVKELKVPESKRYIYRQSIIGFQKVESLLLEADSGVRSVSKSAIEREVYGTDKFRKGTEFRSECTWEKADGVVIISENTQAPASERRSFRVHQTNGKCIIWISVDTNHVCGWFSFQQFWQEMCIFVGISWLENVILEATVHLREFPRLGLGTSRPRIFLNRNN